MARLARHRPLFAIVRLGIRLAIGPEQLGSPMPRSSRACRGKGGSPYGRICENV